MMSLCRRRTRQSAIAHGVESSHRQKIRPFNLSESRTSARTSVPLGSRSNATEASQSFQEEQSHLKAIWA